MNTHIGDKIFQNTPRYVANFRENRPSDVEKCMVGKKIKHGHNITVFRYRWSDTRAAVMSHPAFTPDGRASLDFGWYLFPVPLRARDRVGLSGWLHAVVVCRPKTVTHPGTDRTRRRVT